MLGFNVLSYRNKLRIKAFLTNLKQNKKSQNPKVLFASSICQINYRYIQKFIERFQEVECDFIFFQWDNQNPIDLGPTTNIKIIQCPNSKKWQVLKQYLTPDKCSGYDFIFTWDDDVDICQFSPKNYLNVVIGNKLEVSQPALTPNSVYFHPITVQNKAYQVGRLTDFVEIMVPVFTFQAWKKFWSMIEGDWNYWGWGYDEFMVSACKFSRIGVVDCEPVRHAKELGFPKEAFFEHKKFRLKYQYLQEAKKISYAPLQDLS